MSWRCDLGDVETLPVYDPVSHLVNVAGREHVTDVWVAGERVVEERRLTRSTLPRCSAARACGRTGSRDEKARR